MAVSYTHLDVYKRQQQEICNIDYLLEVIDWDKNVDPDFYQHRFMAPLAAKPFEQTDPEGYREEWICYKSTQVSATRITVFPGRSVTLKDQAAYGMICLQGFGAFGGQRLETPTLIRYGQLTYDEYLSLIHIFFIHRRQTLRLVKSHST